MKRMAPPTTPTTTPAIERLLSLCVSCAPFLFDSPVPVRTTDSVLEAVVEIEVVEKLDVVDEEDVDNRDDVRDVVLLIVEEAMLKLSEVIELVGIDTVGVDAGINVVEKVDVDIVVSVGTGTIAAKIVGVFGRLTTVGTSCDAVGANVPGSGAGAVH